MAEPIPITDFKDLRRLYTKRPQNRDPARSEQRLVYGIDTETYNGDIFLIADSEGHFLDKITPESVIKWLFSKRFQGSWNFCYNLGYDAEVILKLLGPKLYQYRSKRKLLFEYNGYKIEYYPNKCLRIKKGHRSVLFFDIAQFYNRQSLVSAYQQNIGKLSNEYLEMKSKRSEFSTWFYSHNKKKVRTYCIADCMLTKKLAEKWINLFHDAFSFYPAKWTSSGYLAEKVLINKGIFFPKFNFIPYEIQEFAYRCYFGGRFELVKRGFIGHACLYDINSAYPYALTQIPDLTNGKWIRRKSIHPDAKLGFFHIIADIPDCKYIAPFPFRANGQLLFPSGKFMTYVTLAELQACEDPSFYEILDSYQFIPKTGHMPYEEFIEAMYQQRLELKQNGDPMQQPLKIILNSIYGKTGQKVNRIIGNLFNPVLFATITGITRGRLYRFMCENSLEKEVVAFATDSICITKNLGINSKELGEFSFVTEGHDVFYLQNGIWRINGEMKRRGLGKWKGKEIEHVDTFERDGKVFAKFNMTQNTRLRSAILQDNINEIGKIKTIEKELNLNADRKRLWLSELKAMDQKFYNDSLSLCLNYLKKSSI